MNFPAIITRNVIHPLRCKIVPWHKEISYLASELQNTEWSDRKTLYELQEKKLRKLLKGVQDNVPYYRTLMRDTGFNPDKTAMSDLRFLPVMDKQNIRQHFKELINQNYVKKSLIAGATGGSSGAPLQLLHTRESKLFSAALTSRESSWVGYRPGDYKIKLWGATSDVKQAEARLKKRIWNYIYNRELVDAFGQSDELFEKFYGNCLNRLPDFIESYSNILFEMASYYKRAGKSNLNIKAVVTSAGVLYDFQREVIQEQISPNLFNRYGSREFGDIALECDHHQGLHINMERFIVEIIDKDSEGFGDILITDLENHGFPFIRYRIGDRGKLSEVLCPCGRQSILFEQIIGRTLDLVRTPSGKLISGVFFPMLFMRYPQVILGQVVQDQTDHLQIRLKTVNNDRRGLDRLLSEIQEAVGAEMRLTLCLDNDLVTNPTGKYRPVISLIENQ